MDVDCEKLKVVHQRLNEIEQVKDEISKWSAHVKHDNGDDIDNEDKDNSRKVFCLFAIIGQLLDLNARF